MVVYCSGWKFEITKLATNISTSRTLSSSNTYLLLVPTVAPSNLEQSKRQVVGNLVSPSDKTSQTRIVGVLDEEEEKQNILRRKVPATVEGNRPSNSRLNPASSIQRQKQVASHGGLHTAQTAVSQKETTNNSQKAVHRHSTSPEISMLADNLQQLVSSSDQRGYATVNKQHHTVSPLMLS